MPTKVEQAVELLTQGKEALANKKLLPALRSAEEAIALDPSLVGANELLAKCLFRIGRTADAVAAARLELVLDPNNMEMLELVQHVAPTLEASNEVERKWASSLNPDFMQRLEHAAHSYTYRGLPMIKNPFDFALYPLLLWNLKPATVFEIGSFNGTSALWMADQLQTFGVQSHVYSLDIVKVTSVSHPNVTFMGGSGRELEASFPEAMLKNCPRPWLVIDDADHQEVTSSAVLNYFHPFMQAGEYFVIEDGMTAPGPRDALLKFLATHQNEYLVDPAYCDFFGYNVTWCINGFLKRL